MIDPGLGGRVVLITGANNPFGIGAAAARAFAAQGARVFLHYFRQPDARMEGGVPSSPGESFYRVQQMKGVEELLRAIRTSGAKAEAWEADLADAACVVPLFDEAERLLGPVEIVVNNAAHWEADTFIPSGADLRNPLVQLWTDRPDPIRARGADRLFEVNTRAPALIMAEFARRHVARGASWGRIINVSFGRGAGLPLGDQLRCEQVRARELFEKRGG